METAEDQITLEHLPTGTRLLVRSRVDWRFAAVSKRDEGRVVLTVCSPNGRTYRLRRDPTAEISLHGQVPILISQYGDDWHENIGNYDIRW